MQVERTISIFSRNNEDLINEVNIDFIALAKLKEIFNPTEEDPLMYYTYDSLAYIGKGNDLNVEIPINASISNLADAIVLGFSRCN